MNFLPLLLTLLSLSACSGSKPAGAPQPRISAEAELPLPAIPDTMRNPADRATFLLRHFWDAMDFADTTLTRSEPFMERNFVNFVNLYPHAITDSLPAITADLLHRATIDDPSRQLLYSLIDKYLASADSPVASDDTYIAFLSEWVRLPLDSYELIEPRYRLESALKNRPGTIAADFSYQLTDGTTHTLHSTSAPRILLLFYDPDCDHCMATISQLRSDPDINRLIDSGRLTLLAIYTEGDADLWHQTAPSMPTNWTVGIDASSIIDSDIYTIPEMPGLYLLDSDHRVILRQPTLSLLRSTLL